MEPTALTPHQARPEDKWNRVDLNEISLFEVGADGDITVRQVDAVHVVVRDGHPLAVRDFLLNEVEQLYGFHEINLQTHHTDTLFGPALRSHG